MDGYEVLKKLNHLIGVHAEMGCSVQQSPYKDDYFKLFRIAHDNDWFDASSHPRLTGDAISDHFYENWFAEKYEKTEKKEKYLKKVLSMWDEWHYALKKY